MSEGSENEEHVEEVSAGEIPYEELPKPEHLLSEEMVSEGLSEVKKTAGKW